MKSITIHGRKVPFRGRVPGSCRFRLRYDWKSPDSEEKDCFGEIVEQYKDVADMEADIARRWDGKTIRITRVEEVVQ